jgi:antitoxin HicB
MLSYPARLTPGSEGRVMLTLPDIPELVVVAAGEDEAFARAEPLLDTILVGYAPEGKPFPSPSEICGAPLVASRRFPAVAPSAV